MWSSANNAQESASLVGLIRPVPLQVTGTVPMVSVFCSSSRFHWPPTFKLCSKPQWKPVAKAVSNTVSFEWLPTALPLSS